MINYDLGYIYEMGEIHLEGFWYVTHTAFLRLYALKQKEKIADVSNKGYHEGLFFYLL